MPKYAHNLGITRLEAIASEKRDIARDIFNRWHSEVVCPVIRTAERGLFITLLEGLSNHFDQFQDSTNTGMADNRQRPLLTQNHIADLTAGERSAEWIAAQKWYGS